jgi:hypothetical protein
MPDRVPLNPFHSPAAARALTCLAMLLGCGCNLLTGVSRIEIGSGGSGGTTSTATGGSAATGGAGAGTAGDAATSGAGGAAGSGGSTTTVTGGAAGSGGSTVSTACNGGSPPTLEPPTTCSGSTSSELSPNGFYATSWFGCYRMPDNSIYQDPYDNCEFACGSQGLCDAALSGPECEADLAWFAADADRFGCGGRILVTNCENGRSVVLAALDRGPNCGSVEQPCGAATLDMSHPAMDYLFEGSFFGACEHQPVHVEPVDPGTQLGPAS